MIHFLIWALGAFLACSGSGELECDEETACSFGQVCVEGQCVTKSCATSAQCPMEHTCDDGTCTAGCGDESDCYPGDTCGENGTCEAKACRETHLDCGFKEFCNEFSGECYDAGGYYCKTCNDDNDCGGNGNYCYGGFCGVTCEVDTDCPSGFQCYAFSDGLGVQFYQCYTACGVYADSGGGNRVATPIGPVEPKICDASMETSK